MAAKDLFVPIVADAMTMIWRIQTPLRNVVSKSFEGSEDRCELEPPTNVLPEFRCFFYARYAGQLKRV